MDLRPAAVLACLLLLSGCLRPAGDGGPTLRPTVSGEAPPAAAMEPPAWAVGDWWTYETPFGESSYVITADQGSDWFLDTTNPDTAFLDAREDVSRLGPVRKSDLAGSQGDQRVEFFRWPMADGARWQTTWDGEPVTVQASEGTDGAFSFEATNATGPMYRYTYLPRAGWFGELNHIGADGQPDFSLRLRSNGHGFTGDVVRWSLATVVEREGADGDSSSSPFEVSAGATDIWAEYHFRCTGSAGYSVLLQPVNPGLAGQQGAVDGGPCAEVDWQDVVQEAPHPGTWVWAVSLGGATADYDYTILVRTLETIPVG